MKTPIFLVLTFFSCMAAIAQPPMEANKEAARSLKVGIYTNVLNLTPAEAEKFWPLFNEFESKMDKIKNREFEIRSKIEGAFATISDEELEKLIDEMMDLQKQETDLLVSYYEKYKKVLPIKKVALIHRAEMMYKRALLEKMRGCGLGR
ncbi:hypothetical protein GC194_03805 [bacterium]|nr:hypothetical protein [bacterium]